MFSISRNKSNKPNNKVLNVLSMILVFLFPPFGIYKTLTERHMSIGEKIARAIFYLVFWIYSFVLVFFVFWTFYNSFKTDTEFVTDMMSFPQVWNVKNYQEAYQYIAYNGVSFVGMFINSLWFAGLSAFLMTFMNAVTGYIYAMYSFPGKNISFKIILFSIALPIVGSLPSLYRVIYTLNIQESPLILIMYLGGFGSNFLVMHAFFKNVDRTYMEAAEIDGAGRFRTFFRIILPLAFGPFLSLFILTFIGQWNNYETPILFMDTMPTLSSGLYQFKEKITFPDDGITNPRTVFFAGILLASIPVIILVAIFGDKMMKNVNMGGIKG